MKEAIQQLQQMGETRGSERRTVLQIALDALAYHERRVKDFKEVIDLIRALGEDNIERIGMLLNDIQPEGPHGPGCECPPEEPEDGGKLLCH